MLIPAKPIRDVQVGDRVKSRDPVTGKESAKTVTATIKRLASSVVRVSVTDAKTGQSETLTCTPEHPLFVSGQGWVEAGSLGIGSLIVSRAGPALTVQSVTWQRETAGNVTAGNAGGSTEDAKPYTVYNLTVEDDHTYFVGSLGGGTWVHNACAFDWNRAGHIFRDAEGHVDPSTLASQGRFARVFEQVGSNPANLRTDAVSSGLTPPQGAAAGINAFTQVFRNGEQVWVLVRNNNIINAGVNAAGATR